MSDRNDKEKSSNFLLQNIVIGKNTQEMPNTSKKFKNKLATDRAKSGIVILKSNIVELALIQKLKLIENDCMTELD